MKKAIAATVGLSALLLAGCSSTTPASEPSSGPAADRQAAALGGVIVSLGDSYISGEGGRWAGNSNGFTNLGGDEAAASRTDVGRSAYWDAGTEETIPNCHRSGSAEIHLGGKWTSINLACSGATTKTVTANSHGDYKPGIDAEGQLGLLSEVATGREPVKLVVLSIGGNDFNFAPIITACVKGFLLSTRLWQSQCNEDPKVYSNFSDSNVAKVQGNIATAIEEIITTMRDAGYADDSWSLIVQNYPSSVTTSPDSRWGVSKRQLYGGCPMWDADLDWFTGTVLPTLNGAVAGAIDQAETATSFPITRLDLASIFEGRRLCDRPTKLAEETTTDAEFRGVAERVQQVVISEQMVNTPYDMQESLHPNYFGQLALRSCLRQAFNDGNPRSGACGAPSDWAATTVGEEPAVTFTAVR